MASINEEITRIATAKSDIEDAIEECGVDVPDTEKIDTYADYIRAIPSAVLSGLNVDEVGGTGKYIQKIKLVNGKISATAVAFTNATTSASGLMSATDKTKLDGLPTSLEGYLPLSGGIMNKEAYISWNASDYGDSISNWNTVTGHGLRIISSTTENTNAPKTYSTALHVRGSYGFLIASEGGATANSFFIRNISNGVWNTLLHSGNTKIEDGVITINGISITPLTQHQSLANYVTLNTTQIITGLKTFESDSSTTGVSLILKNKGWLGNMSTAMDFYNGSAYKVPNARIETKMIGDGKAGGTLIFYTQTKHASTNPNPNGLTERFRIDDNGFSKITGSLLVTTNITANKFIVTNGTSSLFLKADGSVDSNTYAKTSDSLKNPNVIKFKNTSGTTISYDGSSAVDLTGGINYATKSNILAISTTSITTITNDTTTKWGALSNSIYFYSTKDQLIDLPTLYGFLFNFGYGLDVHLLWLTQASGDLCHRGGNSSGWSGTWRTILDSSNYTNYINTTNFPGLNKTGTVTSVTVTGANGLSGSGTVTTSGTITLSNSGVRSTTIYGNYLRVNTNGNNADLTIPYATTATTASKLSTVSKTAWGQTYWTSEGVPTSISGNMTGVGTISASGSITSSSTTDTNLKHIVSNSNGSVSIYASTNRGLFDDTNSTWILYLTQSASNVYIPKWASKGSTTTPVYFNSSGEPTSGTSYAKAIKGITRSGTTFTYTCIDGTTGTFTLQDTNTTYDLTPYFKYKDVLTSNANFNNYYNGSYVNTTGNGSGNSNNPTTYGYLLAFQGAGSSSYYAGVQFSVTSIGIQARTHWNYDWNSWYTVLTSNNYTNYVTKDNVGLGNVQNTAFYQRTTTVNGTDWDMAGTNSNAAFTIYAPTTAGTSGQVLTSTGGTPGWTNQSSLSVGSVRTGSTSGNTHALAIKSYFESNASSIPRNELISLYSTAYGNGSQYIGYFLSGYNDTPYGGFFVAHYGTPYYVGISNGTYTQQTILTSTNYTSWINTTNFPGLNKTGTITSITLTAGSGISINNSGTAITTSGTRTITNTGVRSTTINGNYLRVNTNGTNTDLTIPYATIASTVTCTEGTSDTTRPIVVTNTSNGLYYATKATINYSTGKITANSFTSSVATGTQPYACTSTTVNTNLNADLLDGLHLNSTTRNNEANKVMRTDSNGYANFGWINTTSGTASGTITRIYCSLDSYVRYLTPANTLIAMISTLAEGTSAITDNTEILTSYASNNGFADTNAPNVVYKRDAVKVYNYIKGKLDSVYLTKGNYITSSALNSSLSDFLLANGTTPGGTSASGTWGISITGSAGSVAWTNVTGKPTITDTKNTAGSTNTSSAIYLIGATTLADNPQTYSHDTVYVGTDGCLYSDKTKVSVEGHTHSYLPLSGGTMTGIITLTDNSNSYISSQAGSAILGFGTSSIYTGALTTNATMVGSINYPTIIRSSSDDLYHYNYNKGTKYLILDSNNLSSHSTIILYRNIIDDLDSRISTIENGYLKLTGGTISGTITHSGGTKIRALNKVVSSSTSSITLTKNSPEFVIVNSPKSAITINLPASPPEGLCFYVYIKSTTTVTLNCSLADLISTSSLSSTGLYMILFTEYYYNVINLG